MARLEFPRRKWIYGERVGDDFRSWTIEILFERDDSFVLKGVEKFDFRFYRCDKLNLKVKSYLIFRSYRAIQFKDIEYLYMGNKVYVFSSWCLFKPLCPSTFSLEINLYARIKSMVPLGGFSFASLNNVFNRGSILAIELRSLVNRPPLFLLNPRDLIPSISFRFTLKSYQRGIVYPLYIFFLILSLFISVYIYIYLQSMNEQLCIFLE